MFARSRSALAVAFLLLPTALAQSPVERFSVSSTGLQADRLTWPGTTSTDGRFALLVGAADNLDAGDTNTLRDVFVRDRQLGTTQRVNLSSSGAQSNAMTVDGSLSADGRFACFSSWANNLVSGDGNSSFDVFVRDLAAGTTERVSVDSSGVEAFGDSYWGSLSGDGRYVLFRSRAPLAGATNFYRILRRDRLLGLTERMDPLPAGYSGVGSSWSPSMSQDGRYVAFQVKVQFAGAPGIHDQVFVYDSQTAIVVQASVGSGGAPANTDSLWPRIAADGSCVVFSSWATNLLAGHVPDDYGSLFVHDLGNGQNELVSSSSTAVAGRGANFFVRGVSNGGRFISFSATSDSLVAADTNGASDVFVKDRLSGATRRVSVRPDGAELPSGGGGGEITADGRFLTLSSADAGLVAGDTNGIVDSFVVDLQPSSAQVYCSALVNSQGCTPSIQGLGTPSLSSTQPFTVAAANLINQQSAWIVYSAAPTQRAFHGGTLCVERPVTLLASQSSGGSASGTDCSGSFAEDFNQRIQSGLDPRLVPGTVVFAQVHSNDPLAPGGYALTAGLAFTVQP